MSPSIIDSANTETIPSLEAGTSTHHAVHRAWLVAVAIVVAATIGLTIAWQATAGASVTSAPTPNAPAAPDAAAQSASAASAGAGLLALAWDLTPPSQRDAVCAQFAADPSGAWAAYSSGADAASIATRAELSAFLDVRC